VADFHRLPEHPGVYCSSLGPQTFLAAQSRETTFSDINIYSANRLRSQRITRAPPFLFEAANNRIACSLVGFFGYFSSK
jgi:hypothetical protein